MKEFYSTWMGTVADMKKWLEQFEDSDEIIFEGGSNNGTEIFDIYVNGKEVICCQA